MLEHAKMVSLDTLIARLAVLKHAGQKVVFTNGCYDIVHPGHVDLLARAKALGDVLVLGLNSDASVQRLDKGKGRPFNAYEARAFVLSHLESIDFVVCFDEDTPLKLIEKISPHVLVKGGDWDISNVVGKDCVESQGGIVYSLPLIEGFSTTLLVKKIADLARTGLI